MHKVLSLGAGVQSTAVLLMSVLGELEPIEHAVFADTGWEPKEVYKNLEWLVDFTHSNSDTKVHVVSCGRNIKDDEEVAIMRGIKAQGQRFVSMPYFTRTKSGDGIVRRQCTREYKIDPVCKSVRDILSIPRKTKNSVPMVEMWYGISSDESQRMRLADKWWMVNHYPLIELRMTRRDCRNWVVDHGFPEPPRSACVACPLKSTADWRHLRDTYPVEFEEACVFDEKIRKNGGDAGDLFVHPKRIPLRSIDFDSKEDLGQERLWDDECAGMCGL